MYSEKVMNEFYNPQNYGVIKGASGVGKVTSALGGEIIKIYIKVENNTITEALFQTFGGVVAIAASSVATKIMVGKAVSTVERYSAMNIYDILGDIPENKMYLVQAVVNAMRAAIDNYNRKTNK